MRTLTDHKLEGLKDVLEIHVHDQHYEIALNGIGSGNAEAGGPKGPIHIRFQTGPVKKGIINGVSPEALLCIVIDRLRCLQSSPAACEAYAEALAHAEASLADLHQHTHERLERERIEAERLAAEKQEAERVEAERVAAERLAAEKLEVAAAPPVPENPVPPLV